MWFPSRRAALAEGLELAVKVLRELSKTQEMAELQGDTALRLAADAIEKEGRKLRDA